jgi:DNA-nicking Smr family endonuclease
MNAGRSGKSGGKDRPGKPEHTDEDDALLWKRIADTTKPLPGRSVKVPAARAKQRTPTTKTSAPAPAAPPKQPERREPPKPPELRPGEAKGLDRRTAERLRRGQVPIEARIDLHGQTQAEAHRALTAFVTGAHKAGRRCVLVITGKGGQPGARRDSGEGVMPDRERGILRRAVPRWLNEPDLRPLILGFAQAQPAHGGAGAVYVLLRRKR